MLMLQNLPTQNWSDSEIGILVAEAYKLKFTFADAPNHFQGFDSRWPYFYVIILTVKSLVVLITLINYIVLFS